jgi:chromate reductase, NAD(P)H dehydrogenase (quinone)
MVKILAIPGSLRENSSSNQILKAFIELSPPDVSVEIYDGVGRLPHFNDAEKPSDEVIAFRAKISNADAVLICTPEYAFGIPGSLKNALDWTVASGEFVEKRVGLITASSQGEKGHAALLLVLQALSSNVVEDATLIISFVRSKLNGDGSLKDPKVADDLKSVITHLALSN